MTGPQKGAPVQLDTERRLRYTTAAIREIEERFDINIVGGDALPFDRLEDVIWLITVGARHAGERLPVEELPWWSRPFVRWGFVNAPLVTQDFIAGQVDMQNLTDVSEALNLAMGAAQAGDVPENPTTRPEAVKRSA